MFNRKHYLFALYILLPVACILSDNFWALYGYLVATLYFQIANLTK